MPKVADPIVAPSAISLGENPVNDWQAREYARESSPSTLAVNIELTENARDNATEVVLTIDSREYRIEKGVTYLTPNRISCEDNGSGMSHEEFCKKFCGAYSYSEAHSETDRAGRNGVGTKTYTSIAEEVKVTTTTARPSQGFDEDEFSEAIKESLPQGLHLPADGEPDDLHREYVFSLHTRSALPPKWRPADPEELGTTVELCKIRKGTEIPFEILLERLSYSREWLHLSAHRLTVQLSGKLPPKMKRRWQVRP